MKTIKELKEELSKFNDDDLCYAYEGEVCGIIVTRNDNAFNQGIIFCGEGNHKEKETEIIDT